MRDLPGGPGYEVPYSDTMGDVNNKKTPWKDIEYDVYKLTQEPEHMTIYLDPIPRN